MIIALILLMVMSMLSIFTIRQAISSTQLSNNTRTQTMAMQAAEQALKACEARLQNFLDKKSPKLMPSAAPLAGQPQLWQTVGTATSAWDGTTSQVHFPAAPADGHYTMVLTDAPNVKRQPECMLEERNINSVLSKAVIITARGFGPEVAAAGQSRSAPVGTEVWLQANLLIKE